MLTIGKLAPGQQAYYLDSVAAGAEEYYTGAKEAPGQWLGRGAELLGLAGEVEAEHLGRVLSHVDPLGGFNLTGGRSAPKVAGFDATFSAPKSVSLLFALGDPETSNVVRNAHDAALRAAFCVYEREASLVRRGHAGERVERGDGLVAAEFRHRTSRAGDPQLHTHVVVANVARDPVDGRWSALHAHPGLYGWAKAVGHLYQAQLRYELSSRLGVDWSVIGSNGTAEIAGFSRAQLREFSQRRVQIESHLQRRGEAGLRAGMIAAHATRTAKEPDATPERLADQWRTRAEAVGLDRHRLGAVLHAGPLRVAPAVSSRNAQALFVELAGPNGLTAARSTFDRRDVLIEVCNRLPNGAPVAKVLALTDRFLQHPEVIAIPTADGLGERWTTRDMVRAEAALLDTVDGQRGAGLAVASPSALEAAIAGRPLTGEQAEMVRRVCGDGDGVTVVAGLAGSGKTYALATAASAWQASGIRVHGVALAARTAQRLQDATGIPSVSVARHLHSGIALGRDDVLVVDEAGMVGTRTLLQLAQACEHAQAKLVLIGDPFQLPELTAGGAFAALADEPHAVALCTNTRQREPWEIDALAELRDGHDDHALAAYHAHDRVHVSDDLDHARTTMVEDWWAARAAGVDAVMLAVTNRDVDALNRHARQLLHADGRIGPDRVAAGDRCFAVGDEVMALRNDARLGVLNGTRGTITAIDTTTRTVTIHTEGNLRRDLPFAYLDDGGLTHAYAMTIHKAQGATVDRAFVLAGAGLPREHAYTAMSRGRDANHLYLAPIDTRVEERHAPELTRQQHERLQAAIGPTRAHQLAINQITTTTPGAKVVALCEERGELCRQLGDVPPDVTARYQQLVQRRDQALLDLREAHWRLDNAQTHLQRRSGLRRIGHRHEHRELVDRINRFTADLPRYQQAAAALDAEVTQLAPTATARAVWEHDHRDQLHQLERLDHRIHNQQTLDRLARRDHSQSIEHGLHHSRDHDVGIDLGL